MHVRTHGIRLLRALERRAPDGEPSPATSAAASPSSPPAVTRPSKSIPALASAMSVFGAAIVLGFVIYIYRTRKTDKRGKANVSLAGKVMIETERNYTSEKHIDLENVSIYMEKPEKAVLSPASLDTQVGWVPQVRSHHGVMDRSVPKPTEKSKPGPQNLQLALNSPAESLARSPPPSYQLANKTSSRHIPIPPSPLAATTIAPTPPTPPANLKKSKFDLSVLSQQESPLPVATPSPRSESFAAQDVIVPSDMESPVDNASFRGNDFKLPRLMSVASSFVPGLEDELMIRVGDTVRMIEEYRDGWCLVQRVGKIDAPRGVVPRFCLQERRGIVPTGPHRKLSASSLGSQGGWR